jgi:potassium efflux system protein
MRYLPLLPFLLSAAFAQEPAPPVAKPDGSAVLLSETNLSPQGFEAALGKLPALTDLAPEIRAALADVYQKGQSLAQERENLAAKKAAHAKALESAPTQLEALRKEAEAGQPEKPTEPQKALTTAELTPILSQTEADADAAGKALEKLREEVARRKSRAGEIPKLVTAAKAKLDEIKVALETPPPQGEAVELTQANRLFLLTRRSFRLQEVDTLDAEQKEYAGTSELLNLQIDRQTAKSSALSKQVTVLRERLAAAGKKEAEEAAAKAAEEALRLKEAFWKSFPELSDIAEANSLLAEAGKQLQARIAGANSELAGSEQQLEKLRTDFTAAKERVEAFELADVPLDKTIGDMLRGHRRQLASLVGTGDVGTRLGEITDASLRELEHRDKRQEYSDVEELAALLVSKFEDSGRLADTSRKQEVADRVRDLIRARRDQHAAMSQEYKKLGDLLTKINLSDIAVRNESGDFSNYVEERVLWIRSSSWLSPWAIRGEAANLPKLADPLAWEKVAKRLGTNASNEPLVPFLYFLAILFVAFGRKRVCQVMETALANGQDRENTSLRPTFLALVCIGFRVALFPSVAWACAHILHFHWSGNYGFVAGVSSALANAAVVGAVGSLMARLSMRGGLFQTHFSWTEARCTVLWRQLQWFVPLSVFLTAWIGFVEVAGKFGEEARCGFILWMCAIATFNYKILHPLSISASGAAKVSHRFWLRFFWMSMTALPVAFALCSLSGYHFTAIEMAWRGVMSVGLFLAVLLVRGIVLRWFYLERKRVALGKLKLRQAQATADGPVPSSLPTDQSITNVNVTEIKEQTQSLTRVMVLMSILAGLWGIWSDITPALKILDKDALWYVESPAPPEGESSPEALPKVGDPSKLTEAGSKAPMAGVPSLQPVTLANVLFALAVVVVTGILFRNLPGFLELMILKHMKLETGGAYAVTTLVQYIVVVVGTVYAFSSIGLTWEKVQWLAAAVTLGIGFGLQEIFANFVAGIILLFERPLRVGDVITVDGTSGTVSRMRIRATTITNWERQELIIPNKDLVTGRLTNWTLTDSTNRIYINVGVAYGSDVRRTREILFEILRDNPFVVEDPQPRVTFDLFGDSTLNFAIRAFLDKLDNRLEAIHTLHEAIDDRFKEAGIEIAFPQRDLHIRSGLEHLSKGS